MPSEIRRHHFGNLFNDVSKVNQGSCNKEFSTYKLNFLHCYRGGIRYFSRWLSWASLYFLWVVCGVYNARFLCWPCQRHSLAVSFISPPSIVTSDQPSTFYLIYHDSWKFLILLIFLFVSYITFFSCSVGAKFSPYSVWLLLSDFWNN